MMFSVWEKSKGSWAARREWQEKPEGPQQAGKKRTKRCPGQELNRDSGQDPEGHVAWRVRGSCVVEDLEDLAAESPPSLLSSEDPVP